MERERCDECGFDSALYDRADTISSQRIMPAVLRAAIEGLDDATMARRPDAQTWSIAEYLDHVRTTAKINHLLITAAVNTPGTDFGDAPQEAAIEPQAKEIDAERALLGIEREFHELQERLTTLEDWTGHVVFSGEAVSVDWFARHVLHDAWHHLVDIGRIRQRFGQGAATAHGAVTTISVSNGGVPKESVSSAHIGPGGVEGDAQADRRHHGRPLQAVCLWSADIIAELASDGHPIAAGNAGENITIEGIEWAALRPGSQIQVGAVPMVISAHAIPCAKNAQWFSDRDFNRILHERNPGYSRLYAVPLTSAVVSVGDAVVIEPI